MDESFIFTVTRLEAIKLILIAISGICWTIVYIDGIRLGFKDRSYAIPFYALAFNFAWELVYTVFGLKTRVNLQTIVNCVWLAFDLGIIYTYFKYGRKYFHPDLPQQWFIGWSVLVLGLALGIEYAFLREFGVPIGAAYSAFLQNLLMSILFIHMLIKRGSREGQSLNIAVNKWLGTLAPTILYGIFGGEGFRGPSFLILALGVCCSIFDLTYIWLLWSAPAERSGGGALGSSQI